MDKSRSIAALLACALPLVHCSDDTANTGGAGATGTTTGTTSNAATTTTSSTTSSATATSTGTGVAPCTSDDGPIFALRSLDMGDGNSGQWKSHGFDIDGKQSNATSTDVCKPNANGSPGTAYPDGDQGIDNSFGKNILPLLVAINPSFPADTNQNIEMGLFTTLAKAACLPAQGDATGITTKIFGGRLLGAAPQWDGTDKWPVQPEFLSNPTDPLSSVLTFSSTSVTGNAFDATGGTFILSIPLQGPGASTTMKFTLYAAHLSMTLSADRKSATGARLGGVLNTEEFVAEMKKVGSLLQVCNTTLFDNLLIQIRQASDIMADGTQDPTKTCDGISVGLAFDMPAADISSVAQPTPVDPACP